MRLLLSTLIAATVTSVTVWGAATPDTSDIFGEESGNGIYRLDFDIHRGTSTRDMTRHAEGGISKRDDSVEMEIKNQRSFYMATLRIGSNNQNLSVLVDTGSSDLWIMERDLDCVSASSSSYKRNMGLIASRPNATRTENIIQSHRKSCLFCDDHEKDGSDGSFTTTIISTGTSVSSDLGGGLIGGGGGSGSGSGSDGGDSSSSGGSNTCTQYGSFSTSSSDSFHKNDSASAFQISYGDGTSAQGFWGYDTVRIGDTSVSDLSFAVVNETDSNVGVLGIGLPGLETTYSSSYLRSPYQYENLPLKLKNSGLIHKNAFSLYLGDQSAKTGNVLFGAVDQAKYSGELQTVPIINTLRSSGYENAIRFEIMVDLISVNDSSSNVNVTNNKYTALLDSGSTLSYFPTSLFEKFGEVLGGSYSSSSQAYEIDCIDNESVQVIFNFSGNEIKVPLTNLTLSSGRTCYLGVLNQQSDYILLGDNALRSMYLVYDLDDYEISVAQAKYTTDEDIKIISSSVPGATNAAYYSSTLYSAASEGQATQTALYRGSSSGKLSGAEKSTSYSKGMAFFTLLFVSSVFFI